jgi:hypothetical protein
LLLPIANFTEFDRTKTEPVKGIHSAARRIFHSDRIAFLNSGCNAIATSASRVSNSINSLAALQELGASQEYRDPDTRTAARTIGDSVIGRKNVVASTATAILSRLATTIADSASLRFEITVGHASWVASPV